MPTALAWEQQAGIQSRGELVECLSRSQWQRHGAERARLLAVELELAIGIDPADMNEATLAVDITPLEGKPLLRAQSGQRREDRKHADTNRQSTAPAAANPTAGPPAMSGRSDLEMGFVISEDPAASQEAAPEPIVLGGQRFASRWHALRHIEDLKRELGGIESQLGSVEDRAIRDELEAYRRGVLAEIERLDAA